MRAREGPRRTHVPTKPSMLISTLMLPKLEERSTSISVAFCNACMMMAPMLPRSVDTDKSGGAYDPTTAGSTSVPGLDRPKKPTYMEKEPVPPCCTVSRFVSMAAMETVPHVV